MEYWEFLLQQEGDRTWQPLKSPTVAIQEGRYRVAVRSSRTDTEVDVRITHESTHEEPPIRRSQQHSRSTNSDGLMVVIPFNYLKPGVWEFRCRPDFITDLMGNSWQHTLQLQVFAKSENTAAHAEEQRALDMQQPDLGAASPQDNPHPIFQNRSPEAQENSDIQLNGKEPAQSNPQTPVFSTEQVNPYPYRLQIALEEETYFAPQGQSLTVSGRIETKETIFEPSVLGGELQICLREPQNSQLLTEIWQILPAQAIPVPFTCTINLPPASKTRLILGEISLYRVKPQADAAAAPLAIASFTITANVDGLLSAIADNFGAADALDLRPDSKTTPLDPSLAHQLEPKEVPTIQFEPVAGVPIPPLLKKSTLRNRPPQPLQLPTLPTPYRPKPKPKAEPVSTESDLEGLANSNVDTAEPDTHLNAELTVADSQLEINPTEENNEATLAPDRESAENSSPVNSSIVALRGPDRFFSRLNSLASDEELSDWLREAPALDPLTIDLDSLFVPNVEPDAHLTASEIVVDDEVLEPKRNKADKDAIDGYDPLPKDEPIPTPKLEVIPNTELSSGQKVRVRVTLPYGLPRLGVKLWIQDRQTRSLLEDPRWVSDFAPNGWGQVEATTQVTVPFGCLEIRFEAIATELKTKRESHKVTIDRTVIPPDLPMMQMEDEFEF